MDSKFKRFGATPIHDLSDLSTRLEVLKSDLSLLTGELTPHVILDGVPIGILSEDEPGDDPDVILLAGRKVLRISVIAASTEWEEGFCIATDEGDAFHIMLL